MRHGTKHRGWVEQRILLCLRRGEEADFPAAADGSRPKVSGKFLTELMIGLPGEPPLPRGVMIRGLSVRGRFDLGNVTARGDGGDLPGFRATDCDFDDGIDMIGARLHWLVLQRCRIAATEDEGDRFALRLAAAEVTHAVQIFATRMDACLNAVGLRVGLRLEIDRLKVDGPEGEDGLILSDARVGGIVHVLRCRLTGPLRADMLRAEGEIAFSRLLIRQRKDAIEGLQLNGVIAGSDLVVLNSRIAGGIWGQSAAITGDLVFTRVAVRSAVEFGAIRLSFCRARAVRVSGAQLTGGLALMDVTVDGDVDLQDVAIDVLRPAGRTREEAEGEYRMRGADTPYALAMEMAAIAGSFSMRDMRIDGPVTLRRLKVRQDATLSAVDISSTAAQASLVMEAARFDGILAFRGCNFANGLSAALLEVGGEVQFGGCHIGSWRISAQDSFSLWMGSATIARDLTFSAWVKAPGAKPIYSVIGGLCRMEGIKVGRNLSFRSVRVRGRSGPGDLLDHSAIILDGARIGRHLTLADRTHDNEYGSDSVETPLVAHGCVSMDEGVIEGDLVVHRSTIAAQGPICRPESCPVEQITEQKIGVALSLRGTRIGNSLAMRSATVTGLVDLRGAHAHHLHDDAGRNWRQRDATSQKDATGRLLLDGFTYDRLDDPPGAMSAARLAWIALSYPDGRPSEASFFPQPYEQLGRVFGTEGHERARRVVMIAKRDAQRRHTGLPHLERWIAGFLKLVSAYGYSPARALVAVAALLGLGSGLALAIDSRHALVPAEAGKPRPDPIPYAIDLAVPIIDFSHPDDARIDAARLAAPFDRQWLIDLLVGVYQLLGVILVSIAVLTFTGTLREKD